MHDRTKNFLAVLAVTLVGPLLFVAQTYMGYGLRQNPQTGSYAAVINDCGARIVFTLTNQATLTISAPGGYQTNCDIVVSNAGVYNGPGTARGVILSVSGVSFPNQGNVLYPGQTTVFSNVSGAWIETGYTQRQLWKPQNPVTFYADAASGSDSTADGLGTGAGANATLNSAFNRLFNFVDYSGGVSNSTLSSTGSFPTGDIIHMAGPLRGSAGNGAFVWNGNGTTTINPGNGSTCFALFDHAIAEWKGVDCEATGTNAACASVNSGSVLYLIAVQVTCNAAGTAWGAFDPGSKIEFTNVGFSFGNSGGTSPNVLFQAQNFAAIIFDSAQTITFLGNASFQSADILVTQTAQVILGGSTFDTTTHSATVTGTRFVCAGFSLLSAGASPNSTVPGSSAGSIGPDCFSNSNFTTVPVTLGGTGLNAWTGSGIPYGAAGGIGDPSFVGPCGNNVPITGTGAVAGDPPQCGGTIPVANGGTGQTTVAGQQGTLEQGMTLLNIITVTSGDASEQDTTSLTSAYNDYLIVLDNIVPATNAVGLELQVQSGGSFQTSSYINAAGGATAYLDLTSATNTIGNTAGIGLSATLYLHNVNSTTVNKFLDGSRVVWYTGSALSGANVSGFWNGGQGTLTGLKWLPTTGNFSSGTIRIYGLRGAL
jgi:hypothetical protein